VGHFCPPGSGSGSVFKLRIRIQWSDLIRIQYGYGSGSETLVTTAGTYFIVYRSCCKHRRHVCFFIFRHGSHELPARHLWSAAQLLRQRQTGGGILRSASSSVSDPPDPNPDWFHIQLGQWIRIQAGRKCPLQVLL
jgi:hypothetical protein